MRRILMRGIFRESVRASVVVLASAALTLAPGLATAQSQGSEQVSDGAKQPGQGTAETGKSADKSAAKAPQSAGEVGDRLHDGAKSFGEALLGGIKYAGRTVINFFNDDKK
jgi:hypothetical protein